MGYLGHPSTNRGEVALVQDFAAKLKVEVQWLHAPMFEALEALDRGDADLATGGFAEETVSTHPHVGPTYAYFEDALVVAAPPDVDVPSKLSDQRVEVAPSLLSAGLIEEKGGVPVPPEPRELHSPCPTGSLNHGLSCQRESSFRASPASWPCRRARTAG